MIRDVARRLNAGEKPRGYWQPTGRGWRTRGRDDGQKGRGNDELQ